MNSRNDWVQSTNKELVSHLEARKAAVFHYDRKINLDDKGSSVQTVDTACVIKNPDGTYSVGISIMSPYDTYDRRVGNAIAFARASTSGTPVTGDVGAYVRSFLENTKNVKYSKFNSELVGRNQYSIDESEEFTTRICENLNP